MQEMREHAKGCLHGILKVFFFFILITIIFNLVFRVIYVDGESMMPTLESGDWIMACRFAEPKREDIIITNTDNQYKSRLIKRVIAFEGETVDIDFDTGTVYIDGKALDEPYLGDVPCVRGNIQFPVTVPEGKVFLLGDNRENSTDSRYKEIGFVDANDIIGPVWMRLLPMPFSFV